MPLHVPPNLKQRLLVALAAFGVLTLVYALYVLVAPEPVDRPPERLSIATGAGARQLGATLPPTSARPGWKATGWTR